MLPLFESIINFTDLRAFIAIAIKHRRLMVLCMCLGLTSGLAFMVYKKPVYYSKSLINVIQEAPLPVDTETIFRDSSRHSIISQLNAPHIYERAARSLGIQATYNGIKDKYIRLQRVSPNSEADLELNVWPYSVHLAREWPQALVNAYLQYRDEKRFERRENVIKSYTEEMLRIREKMAEFEHTTRKFTEDREVDETQRRLAELAHVPGQLARANARLAFLEQVKNELESGHYNTTEKLSRLASVRRRIEQLEIGQAITMDPATNITPQALAERIVTPDLVTIGEPWQRLEREQRRLRRQLRDAASVYLPGHRVIIDLNQQLEKVDRELELELEMSLNQFNLEWAALQEEKSALEEQMDQLREISRQNTALTRDFNLLQATRLSWEKMFKELASRLEQMEFGADKDRTQIQYMGILELREHPLSPNKHKVFIYALLIGAGLAIALPFLLEYLDDTLVVDEQVERILKVRTIAVIPEIDRGHVTQAELSLTSGHADHRLNEYFRVLRVNLTSNVHFEGNRQVFMVTSALPREGKSVIALNLAVAFARLGEKTLLIDADLRRGTLHRVFKTGARPGLGQILEQGLPDTAPSPIQKIEDNLDLIACGRHAHSSSEKLESQNFTQLIREMRQHYTRVIIDTPPVLGLAETVSMVKHADGVILVVWSGNTAMKAVTTAKGMLDANGAKYFGCALNKLDLTNAATYYYYYYYSYKYYQAYHTTDENAAPNANETTAG